jgi:hypothetical protein
VILQSEKVEGHYPFAQVTSDKEPATKPGHCCQNILLQDYYYFSDYANHRANN